MTMRDYRNLAWKNQQLWERNPNPPRSMRDYRDQWMNAPSYMVPPQYTSTPQPPQPPQLISPIEQAILDLTKLMGDAVVEQKKFNAQLRKKIHAVENPLEEKSDGFQSEMGQQFSSLQCSVSKLAQKLDHQGEEGPEEECLSATMVEKHSEQQLQEEMIEDFVEVVEGLSESSNIGVTFSPWKKEEQISALIIEEGSGIEAGEEPQKPTTQATNSPLPVYILPTPAANPTRAAAPAPKAKATPSLPMLKTSRS